MNEANGLITCSSAITRSPSTLMTISKRRQIFAAPLPATTVSAALWMSRPARYSMHSLHLGMADDTRVIYTSDHGDAVGKRGLWGKSTLYEETTGVPLIAAGDGFPQGLVVDTPANLVDIYPFILDCVGDNHDDATNHTGFWIARLANGELPDRTVLSEYHGMGSTTGAFAIRHRQFKYVHYVKYPPQLFDLASDPHEERDLSSDPRFGRILAQC